LRANFIRPPRGEKPRDNLDVENNAALPDESAWGRKFVRSILPSRLSEPGKGSHKVAG
jgi:hypothetical protein